MSEQQNTGLVQQAYDYFQSGDIPTLLGLLSEDVEWLIPGRKECRPLATGMGVSK
jgi:ketosteroid isomerase-like protein